MSDEEVISYQAGPTAARFHASSSFVRGLMGPVGAGKSVACCIEIMRRALQQTPNQKGIRQFRVAIIRNSYPELKTTTIQTWQDWFPESVIPFNWGPPITAKATLPAEPTDDFPDGTTLEFEAWFLSLDRPADIKKLLGLELTMAWINEARELPYAVVEGVTQRLGRYPSKRSGAPIIFTGLIMDTNPPDDDHWWYRLAEIERPKGYEFFRQPGALLKVVDKSGETIYTPNPKAENIDNIQLGYEYYLNMIVGKSSEWIKSYVLGQYATVYNGRPVYPEYNDEVHCAKEDIEPMRGMPLFLGWDFGLTPACAIFQISPTGQLRVIDECVSERSGIRRFIREVVRPKLNNEYAGMQIRAWGDPSGVTPGQAEEGVCFEVMAEEGLSAEPASTQDPIKRRESVAYYLMQYDSNGEPGLLLSPRCKTLRKGFNGAFQYERIQVANEERYRDKPKKNIYSHVHEALQYGAMETLDGIRIEKVEAKPVRRRTSKGWAA